MVDILRRKSSEQSQAKRFRDSGSRRKDKKKIRDLEKRIDILAEANQPQSKSLASSIAGKMMPSSGVRSPDSVVINKHLYAPSKSGQAKLSPGIKMNSKLFSKPRRQKLF